MNIQSQILSDFVKPKRFASFWERVSSRNHFLGKGVVAPP